MGKVYVVTSGDYSDYAIDAVFSSKEKAEAYIGCYQGYSIDEYGLDTEPPIPVTSKRVSVSRERGNNRICIDPESGVRPKNSFRVYRYGEGDVAFDFFFPPDWDDERCRKVASDTVAQWVVKCSMLDQIVVTFWDRKTLERTHELI